jgi:hypothetical protein
MNLTNVGRHKLERLTPLPRKLNNDDGVYRSNEAHFAVTPVTAKRNIESRVRDEVFHRFETTKILIAATSKSRYSISRRWVGTYTGRHFIAPRISRR